MTRLGVAGVIFDLDGTLVDSDKAYDESLSRVGVERGDAAFADYLAARDVVKKRLGSGNPNARNRLLYFKQLLETQKRFSSAALLSLMDRYEAALAESFAEQWRALGRQSLLESIAAKFPCVLLTNENTRTQLIKVRAIDPQARLFRRVITSEEIGVEKPDRRMFLEAFDAVGAAPGRCLVVGDDLKADIEPAVAWGAGAVWTTEFHAKTVASDAPHGARLVKKLDELLELLA